MLPPEPIANAASVAGNLELPMILAIKVEPLFLIRCALVSVPWAMMLPPVALYGGAKSVEPSTFATTCNVECNWQLSWFNENESGCNICIFSGQHSDLVCDDDTFGDVGQMLQPMPQASLVTHRNRVVAIQVSRTSGRRTSV